MAKKLRDEDLVLNIIINGNKSKKEMNELERAITDTNREINQLKKTEKELAAQNKKDTEAYKTVTAAIKQKEAAVTMAESRLSQLRKGMKLTEMTSTDLAKEIKRLTSLMNASVPHSENWNKYKDQLGLVRDRFKEVKEASGDTEKSFMGIDGKLGAVITKVAAVAASLGVFVNGLIAVGKAYMDLSDDLANVRKTTGLTSDEVYDLNDQLAKIDTRTAQKDLLGLATVAGKLGISAKEDVLGFVRAADQIGVALGEDLGDVEQAVNDLGKLTDLFRLKDQFGLEGSLLKTGSAINALGAAGTANEGYIVEFTKRMGTIAPAANISMENIMGLAATMDQLGQPVEASSTAIAQFVVGMGKDIPTFAKVAGMSVKEFSTLLRNDGNAALISILEKLKSTGGGVEELAAKMGMIGEDGARATAALGALSGGLDILRANQKVSNDEFARGTSLTNEFMIKNQNFAAVIEKISKLLNSWATNGAIAKMLDDWSAKFANFIGLAGSASEQAVAAYKDQLQSVNKLESSLPKLIEKYEALKSKTNLNTEEQVALRDVIQSIQSIVPSAATSFDLYGRAIDINKGKVKEFLASQKEMLKLMNREALITTAKDIDTIKESQQRVDRILRTRTIAESGSVGVGGVSTVIRPLTDKEIRKYQEIQKQNALKLEKARSLYKGLDGSAFDTTGENSKVTTTTGGGSVPTFETDAEKKKRESEAARLKKEQEVLLKSQAEYRKQVVNSQKTEIERENIDHLERLKKAGIDENNVKKEQIDAFEALEKIHQANLSKIDAQAITKGIEDKKKAYEKQLSDLRTKNFNELAQVDTVEKAKKLLKDKLSQEELNKIKTLNQAKKALKDQYDFEEQELTRKQAEELMGILNTVMSSGEFTGINLSNKILSEDEKKVLVARLQELSEYVAKVRAAGVGVDDQGAGDEQKKFSFEGDKGDILGFTNDDWNLFFDHLKSGQLAINDIGLAVQSLVGIWSQYNQIVANGERKQLQQFENNTNAKKAKLKQQLDAGVINQEIYSQEVEKLDSDLERKRAENDRNAAVRDRNAALMGAIVNTALGVTKASPNIFLMGLVGALGAMQIATIVGTPLPELPGKEDGGFVDVRRLQDRRRFRARNRPNERGFIDKPTVLVSEAGTEFVANADAVNNPTVRPVLDLIDSAQQNGSISTLNLERILNTSAALRAVRGKEAGGFVSDRPLTNGTPTGGSIDPELIELLKQATQINRLLIAQFSKPIPAEVVLTGKNGLIAKQQELDTIIKNSSF